MYSFPGEAKPTTEARPHSAAPATTPYSASQNLSESGRPTGYIFPGVGAYSANMATIPGNHQPYRLLTGDRVSPPGIERSHITGSGSAPATAQPSSDRKNKFSEKVAILKDYMYDGERNGGQWRLVVRPYLIFRAPGIETILNFVESNDDIMASVGNLLAHRIVEDDELLIDLAADFWGFLTLNLQGMARLFVNKQRGLRTVAKGRTTRQEQK